MAQSYIIRHHWFDRVFHWLFALVIFILLGTGLLPVFGIDFSWVVIHWCCGLLFLALLLIHIIRAIFWKDLRQMTLKARDFSTQLKPGKYSLPQKAMHHFIAIIILLAIATGLLMMVKIDTPFWERDPYWLGANTWGLVYFIHGLMALSLVSTIMLHIYFALRPEKRLYLRSIKNGRISREEYEAEHDVDLWPVAGLDQDKIKHDKIISSKNRG